MTVKSAGGAREAVASLSMQSSVYFARGCRILAENDLWHRDFDKRLNEESGVERGVIRGMLNKETMVGDPYYCCNCMLPSSSAVRNGRLHAILK